MNSKSVTAASIVLLAQHGAAIAAAIPAQSTTTQESRQHLTLASKMAIESSWIRVPMMCKDRSFAFEPVVVESEAADTNTLALFASLDQQA